MKGQADRTTSHAMEALASTRLPRRRRRLPLTANPTIRTAMEDRADLTIHAAAQEVLPRRLLPSNALGGISSAKASLTVQAALEVQVALLITLAAVQEVLPHLLPSSALGGTSFAKASLVVLVVLAVLAVPAVPLITLVEAQEDLPLPSSAPGGTFSAKASLMVLVVQAVRPNTPTLEKGLSEHNYKSLVHH